MAPPQAGLLRSTPLPPHPFATRRPMSLGRRLLVFSATDPQALHLARSTAGWGCVVSACSSLPELRGRLEGGDHDLVLVEPAAALRPLLAGELGDEPVQLPLAEVEKRHILRVLAAMNGNKTRAARILGIDTKTLYNKVKSYQASEAMARRRQQGAGSTVV